MVLRIFRRMKLPLERENEVHEEVGLLAYAAHATGREEVTDSR